MIEKPVFLVGAERSGTTLLRALVKHHPDISWLKEFEYCVDLVSDKGDYPNLDTYYQYLENDRIFRSTGLKINRDLNYPELVNDFLEQQRKLDRKPVIVATVHRHFDRLLSIWSDARFIHIIRDPRDVARSCIGMGWAGNVWYGIDRWIQVEKLWSKLKTQISADRYIEISYENLIREPEKNLTAICNFLQLTYNPAMLDPKNSTYGKPDPRLAQQWRQKLSDREIQLVESKVGDLLVQKQYEHSGLPPLQVSNLTKQQLSWQNWWYRINFRIDKFGLPLLVSNYLSRKLKLRSLYEQNQLEIAEIKSKQLK